MSISRFIFIVLVITSLIGITVFFLNNNNDIGDTLGIENSAVPKNEVRYAALGDSYTAGYGVQAATSYPYLLTDHLRAKGVTIELANMAISGSTTDDVLTYQLPNLERTNVNFVTILIGGNDIAHREDVKLFQQNYITILNRVQKKLPKKHQLVLITLPDFSGTPYARTFGYKREDVQKEIMKYNTVITTEAKKRNLAVVDLYATTGSLEEGKGMILEDGLHPTPKQYAIWEEQMYPVVYKTLQKS